NFVFPHKIPHPDSIPYGDVFKTIFCPSDLALDIRLEAKLHVLIQLALDRTVFSEQARPLVKFQDTDFLPSACPSMGCNRSVHQFASLSFRTFPAGKKKRTQENTETQRRF